MPVTPVLSSLGFDEAQANAFDELALDAPEKGLSPGRLIRQESLVRVQLEERTVLAKPSKKLLRDAATGELLPVVGDFVAVSAPTDSGTAFIQAVLPRRSVLSRRQAGDERNVQAIAANVELVFLVNGLDSEINVRRLERMLAITLGSGARPIVVLSKADLAKDAEATVAQVKATAGAAPVIVLSAQAELARGVAEIERLLGPGVTGVMIGPSGVGKSTLMNRLLSLKGDAELATFAVRADDREGRHTTTHRQLFVLPNGGMLIDGPGMREFGLWTDDAGIAAVFEDVEGLAQACRFGDCSHSQEPGCAVREALDAGKLDEGRFAAWKKLQAERAYQASLTDPNQRRLKRRADKASTTAVFNRTRHKKKRS